MSFHHQECIVFIVAVLIGILSITVEGGKVTDCTSNNDSIAKLKAVTISDCDTNNDDPCQFVQKTNASIEVEFETIKPFKEAKLAIFGKIVGMKLPFPMKPDDACGNYGFNCPVNANENKKLKITLPILPLYPKVSVKAQLNMYNEDGEHIVCIEFPAKIVSKATN